MTGADNSPESDFGRRQLEQQLETLVKERDGLRAALTEIAKPHGGLEPYYILAHKIAVAALK